MNLKLTVPERDLLISRLGMRTVTSGATGMGSSGWHWSCRHISGHVDGSLTRPKKKLGDSCSDGHVFFQ